MRLLKLALLALPLVLLCAPAAFAAGTPDITIDKSAPERVLFGEPSEVTLTASNPGPPNTVEGYNLTFRDVLPAGIAYVPGSAEVEPRILANAPLPGQTTLIFENVSDLSPNSEYSLTYQVQHSTTQFAVGQSYTNTAQAFLNTDPRFVPRFTVTNDPPRRTRWARAGPHRHQREVGRRPGEAARAR
jgi:large repetitive protein